MLTYFVVAFLFVAACNGQAEQGDQVRNAPAQVGGSQICKKRNGYYKQDGSCDAYIECRDFQASHQLCPDGMNYNPSAKWPEYACGYPVDVPCLNRGVPQPAKPTADCPHQYGFYPSLVATPDRCGNYRMCVKGESIEMICPVGLAFNPVSGRCDWPDQVPACKVDDFLGFRCPAAPIGDDGQPLDIVLNYEYEGECSYFFSCEKGRARLLACDYGLAFDPVSAKCIDADLVQCHAQPVLQASQSQPISAANSRR